jgi:L-threonylcarbamoyladenylate synthase
LTILVSRGPRVLDAVTGGLPTVGIRVPAHPLTQVLLARFGGGLAAPSANRFGRVSPTTAQHVRDDLGDEVDFVLDGGSCPIGVESTIVDCTVAPAQILRSGGISDEEIARLLAEVQGVAAPTGPSRASGMLASHYAPAATVVLVDSPDEALERVAGLRAEGRTAEVFDPTQDLVAAARNLYSTLRDADRRGVDTVVAVLPAPAGLGHALRDRLSKAAGRG